MHQTPLLLILLRGIDDDMTITEEMLDFKGQTRGTNLFLAFHLLLILMECLPWPVNELDCQRYIYHRHFQQFLRNIQAEYGDVLYHNNVRWLSRGSALH